MAVGKPSNPDLAADLLETPQASDEAPLDPKDVGESDLFESMDIGAEDSLPLSFQELSTSDAARLAEELKVVESSPGASLPPISADGTGVNELTVDPCLGFAGVLAQLWKQKETGILLISAEASLTRLYLLRGIPVFAEDGALGDTLGRMLVRSKKITEQQLAEAISHMTDQLVANEQVRLGEVLIELGYLRPEDVHQALQRQFQDKILTCFRWPELRAQFEPGEDFLEEIFRFPASLQSLIYNGILQHYDPTRLDQILAPHADQLPRLTEEISAVCERLQLGPSQRRFLSSVNGDKNIRSLQDSGSLDRIACGQLLATLIVLELVELRAAKAPVPRATSSAPSLRSVPPQAEGTHPQARAPNPPRPPAVPGRAVRAATRTKEDEENRLRAEGSFLRGKGHLDQGQPGAALPLFKKAVELRADALEYQLYLAYAEFLTCNNPGQHKVMVAKVRSLATSALQKDKPMAKAHTILGQLYKLDGRQTEAEKQFRLALAQDPSEPEAMRELRLHSSRNKGTKKGKKDGKGKGTTVFGFKLR